MTLDYPFTQDDMDRAAREWGCNCGPSALAFALQVPLERVRGLIPGFETKRYTSPTMMRSALTSAGRAIDARSPTVEQMFADDAALVRVQWTGPWTAPGSNPRWAFDCNGGLMTFERWTAEIVPLLTGDYKRADGGWLPTHVWRLP